MSHRATWVAVVVAFVVSIGTDLALGATRPGLIAGIGFFGCVGLILGSKWLGKTLLSRPDAYWAETDQPDEKPDDHPAPDPDDVRRPEVTDA